MLCINPMSCSHLLVASMRAPCVVWLTFLLTLRVSYTPSCGECCEYVCVLRGLADVLAHHRRPGA